MSKKEEALPHKTEPVPPWISVVLEIMGIVYVAVAFLFWVKPDSIILWVNTAFLRYGWPSVFFPTEKFWYALAWSVPATRAFLTFVSARRPDNARLLLYALQVSLVTSGAMFAFQFVFHRPAPLYALACLVELAQAFFCYYLMRKLS